MPSGCRAAIAPLFCALSAVCDTPSFSVRLQTPLTSYSTKRGSEVRAVAISNYVTDAGVLIPQGAPIHGSVRQARSVGSGLIHERALLELDFHRYDLPDGRSIPFDAQVLEVDNAREDVTPDGQILGVLAAGGVPSLVRGIWGTPSAAILQRPLLNVTGISARIWTEYGLGPLAAAGLLTFRWLALRFPEPEIRYGRGTEMTLAVTSVADGAPVFPDPVPNIESTPLSAELAALPHAVLKPSGKPADDVINIAFRGTGEELQRAFSAAGWSTADALSRSTFTSMYKAFVSMQGYPQAPVSRLLYDGREPDFVFQKSLNTVAKRHHVRIWRLPGHDVWIGSGTHDTGVGFDPRLRLMTHKINGDIDRERAKIASDLAFAGCVQGESLIERSGIQVTNADNVRTDGHLTLLNLQPCRAPETAEPHSFTNPGNKLQRMGRRFALETRHYVLRDNAYHWTYRTIRLITKSARRNSGN